MFFSAISKTLNWEILTKNLVTLKRSDGVKDMGGGGRAAGVVDRLGEVVFLRGG